ncbi:MAG: BACON domain-containing protein [Alistipes sp.]|nr:BACON domain-containing protein [Alistipes sp.]
MKLRNLFSLLLALTLVSVSCSKNNDEPIVSQDPVLTLTSNSTMEFTADGGDGVITYTLENAVEGVAVKAECNAKWIKDLTVAENITFTVNPNAAGQREAKIVVSYQTSSFEVTVKQAEEVNTSEYLYDLTLAVGTRVSSQMFNFPENYVVVVLANEVQTMGVSLVFVCDEGETVLSAGTYTTDNGTIIGEECEFMVSAAEKYAFGGGNVTAVVEGDVNNYHIDVVFEDVKGNRFHAAFNGKINNMLAESVNFEAKECGGYCLGACSKGSWEYGVYLSDLGLGANDTPKANATYYKLDLFSVEGIVDADGMVTVPAGTYTFDAEDTLAEWTIGNEDSQYLVMNSSGVGATIQSPFATGTTLVVTEDNATLTTYIQGVQHVVTYNGALKVEADFD